MEEKHKDTGVSTASTTKAQSPATDPPSSRRRGGGQKRKASNFSSGNASNQLTSSSSKRQAREKSSSSSAVPFQQIHNGPWTRARQQPNYASNSDSTTSWDVANSEASIAAAAAEAEAALKVEREDWEALEAKIQAEYELIRSRDVNAHVVPNHCGWFSWTKIHQLEEKSLPSFFNGKSETRTPEIYLEIRNSIMNRFHADPNTLLEVKDLSELSVGELDARQEVMEFLDYWGLINYHPLSEPSDTSLTVDAEKAFKKGSLVDKLYKFEVEQSSTPVAVRNNVATPSVQSRLLPESVVAEELVKPEEPSVEYHCNSCAADCSRKRYHCQKQADFDLCTECFNDRKFDPNMTPSDFILMEPAQASGASSGKWTDQETLLLLEALELFAGAGGENWNEIAEHVATKTKAQCILHFVQMPIEDTFLDSDIDRDATLKENTDSVATNENASAPTDDAVETTESKDDESNDKLLPSPVEISKPKDDKRPEVRPEVDTNPVLKALKEAFEAVGSLPSQDEKLSFADAGNPVMSLAVFLGRLVEPNVVTALARSSLKSISSNSSGAQLAARHCFIVDDPGKDTKIPADTERGVTGTADGEGQKDENGDGKRKDLKSNSIVDDTDSLNDRDNGEDKAPVAKEKQLLVSSDKDKELVTGEKVSPENDKDIVTKDIDLSVSSDKDNGTVLEGKTPVNTTAEKSHGASEPHTMDTEENSESPHLKETNERELQKEPLTSGDGALAGGPSQSSEAPKDEEMVENGLHPDGEEAKGYKNEKKDALESTNYINLHKIKRAAATAISAAAVKAKLLADQEEDQIRLLATSLIEKQLHKLEAKLAFFSEMDSVVMRVREQLERSKQKLYHERAQIIAARLGISGSSSRPAGPPQSLPSKVAMTFPNAVPRPPVSITSQKPPLSRP